MSGILDTGSSFLTIPKDAYTNIIKIKYGNENYCTDSENIFPIIALRIND
jgi:hypothetical protein